MAGSFYFLDEPEPAELLADALRRLEAGELPSAIESTRFDFKEDPTRRGPKGSLSQGLSQDNSAARKLAAEVAAMANTRGGGALLIGVDDKTGTVIGCTLDAAWLERKIFELLGGQVAVHVAALGYEAGDFKTQLLAIEVQFSHQPIEFDGKVQERKNERKVTRTPTEALQGRYAALGVDPSAQLTTTPVEEVSPQTESVLRATLGVAQPGRFDTVALGDIVAAIGLASSDDQRHLNHAGVLLLCNRDAPRIDYHHRPSPGTTSKTERVNLANASLLVELQSVLDAIDRHNPATDVVVGSTRRSYEPLPHRSNREAVVNAVAHRDWARFSSHPTIVEHIGHQLRVTSPGGLIDGITTDNILTHSSKPRYLTLLAAFRNLGLAEQQGVGIDTIHRELITIGARPPEITAQADEVVVVLNGVTPDRGRIEFFNSVAGPAGQDAAAAQEDVDFALVIDRLTNPVTPWITVESCAPVLQRTLVDAEYSLARVADYTAADHPVFRSIRVPTNAPKAWTLTKDAEHRLGVSRTHEQIEHAAAGWLTERGRISSTEYLALFSVSQPTATNRLQQLELAGILEPSNSSGGGRGFHYTRK